MMNTSPGRTRPRYLFKVDARAKGMEPNWKGMVTPWEIIRPSRSHRAVEKSMQSRITVE